MNSCGGRVVGTMAANPTRKPADAEPDQFPAGLRVLVVDDDPTCLKILERMLRTCQYVVTKCDRAEYALNELRRNKNGFDIVISDVHMPDMDGFKLLEHIGLEMDLPVIMMSADDSKNVVMKGVTHGACDYLIKPVRIEALKNIWQHVIRKKKNVWKDVEHSGSLDECERAQKQEDTEYTSSANDGNWKSSNRKGEDEEVEDRDDNTSMKKARVVWSVELHQQFVAAVNQLGIDKAVPKKILEMMNVPGLTRENVASHLQKYRLYLRRLSGMSHHHGGFNASFMSPQEAAAFGSIPPLGGFDLQTLAVASQLPRHALAGYQSGLARSAIKPGISMPFIDQSNLFSFETSKQRFAEEQHLQQMNNTNKQLNFLHGIPTTMDLKHLSGFHQSAQSLGSLTMQQSPQASQSNSLRAQMSQPHTRSGQIVNERIGSQFSQIQTSMGQSISPAGVLPRTVSADSNRAMSYGSVSQASSAVDFAVNYVPDLPGNSFPVGSAPAMATSKRYIQEEVNSNGKRARSFGPSYDMFNEIPQQKAQDWQSSSLGSIANNIDVSPSIMVNQGFSGQNQGQYGNHGNRVSPSNTAFSTDTLLRQGSNTSVNTVLIDNASSRVKTETAQELSSRNNLYPYQFAQDDLMSAMLKQQEGVGAAEGEFDFDGYTMDNISV